MEFRQLRYFVTIAQELHFGRAAKYLDITQPALSKQIQVLENKLGVQLLTRSQRQVSLTPAGEIFALKAKQLLEQAEEAIAITKRTALGEVGRLTIGFTATATYTVLPQLISRFRLSYPHIEVEMLELSTEEQVAALNQETIDLGFLHPPIDSRGLEVKPILAEEFVVVLPPKHPLHQKRSLSVKDLANESFLLHPRSEGPFLYDGFCQICHVSGFQPKIVKEVGSHQTRVCLAMAGMGVTFIPAGLQTSIGNNVVCKPIENLDLKLEFAAAWRSPIMTTTLQGFLELLETN